MDKSMNAHVAEQLGDATVVLQSVNIEAVLNNLLCEVTIHQKYKNMETVNIEAVCTFPLPLNAVLLDLTIKTKTRLLKGMVVEKLEAEDRYEDAITEGDTAIMLEQVQPGLYTINAGNLQPGDEIDISITYSELYKWRDNSLRFFLPTTIAPRYGDPESVGIQPHQIPEYDLMTDNPFSLSLSILGNLADASFQSPSHRIQIAKVSEKTVISLKNGHSLMDRDFVLNIVLESEKKDFALSDRDGDDYVALASFYPKFPDVREKAPRDITIIVDCSGSMAGDSIAQAKKALYEILELLRPEDSFNVIRFGSKFSMLFPTPVNAGAGNLKKARNLLEIMDADMGGTEIGQAVSAVITSKAPRGLSREVLLITDGEVWNWEKITQKAAKSDCRFFTVGVGSSVSEAFVQTLADVTGGACELVSPHEDMAEKIVRHFKRIYFPHAENVTISWPCKADKVFPKEIKVIYDSDTVHVFGRFKENPEGDVTLTAKLEDGEMITQKLAIGETSFPQTDKDMPGTVSRMAAAYELKSLTGPQKIATLAVKYQLMSRHTNYLAIDVKADGKKAVDLPELRKIPQMLAAGWKGTGSVLYDLDLATEAAEFAEARGEEPGLKEPMSLYSKVSSEKLKQDHYEHFIDAMNRLHTGMVPSTLAISSIQDLKIHGVPEDVIQALIELRKSGIEEYVIVVTFLYHLSQQDRNKKAIDRSLRRIIIKAYKRLPEIKQEMSQKIEEAIAHDI